MTDQEISTESKLNIRFFGPIIGIVGKSREEITLEHKDVTVKEIVMNLCKKYGEKFEVIALNKGELNPGLIVFVNGVHVTNGDRKLSVTDEIQVMIASQMKGG